MSAQTPEQLLFDDESLPLVGDPLAPWLARERLLVHENPADCRRGYVGTWRLHGARLCLMALAPAAVAGPLQREGDERPAESSMAALFGSDRPVWAEWFSGRLCCPNLPCLRYSDYGIPQPAQHDLVIELVAGRARRIGFDAAPAATEAPAAGTAGVDATAHAAASTDTGWHWRWPMPAWRPAMRRWHLLPHRAAH